MKKISNKTISLTETTQSIITRPKVPMTLDDFKKRYNELLNFHLNEYVDHSELTFAKMWADAYLNLSSILQKSTDHKLLTTIEKQGLEALKKKQYYQNLKLSFNEIRKFLKQRMKVVKKELKTKPESPQQNVNMDFDVDKQNKPDFKIPYSIMNDAISTLQLALIEDKKVFPIDVKQEQTYVSKPCFKAESIDSIIITLKDFFDVAEHVELRRIIETGSNVNGKLLFRDNGNRLTDYFKRLIQHDIITGCNKKDLINWIIQNFKNIKGDYNYKTVENTISSKENSCKKQIT